MGKRLNKVQPLFPKRPAQHFANLAMIENEEAVGLAFVNCTTHNNKDIECIRVDDGADEGQCTKTCNTGGLDFTLRQKI